jgi:hypothetical protein
MVTILALTLHPFPLSDLGRETRFDGRDGPPRLTGVAGDEVQSVLALTEFCVARPTGLARDVFNYTLLA